MKVLLVVFSVALCASKISYGVPVDSPPAAAAPPAVTSTAAAITPGNAANGTTVTTLQPEPVAQASNINETISAPDDSTSVPVASENTDIAAKQGSVSQPPSVANGQGTSVKPPAAAAAASAAPAGDLSKSGAPGNATGAKATGAPVTTSKA